MCHLACLPRVRKDGSPLTRGEGVQCGVSGSYREQQSVVSITTPILGGCGFHRILRHVHAALQGLHVLMPTPQRRQGHCRLQVMGVLLFTPTHQVS